MGASLKPAHDCDGAAAVPAAVLPPAHRGSAQTPRKRIAFYPVLPYVSQVITYEWRGLFDNAGLNALHAEGFSHKEDYWKLNSKKYRPIAARKESRNVLRGRR